MDREWVEGLITGLVFAVVICGAGIGVGLVWRRSYLRGWRQKRAEQEAEAFLVAPHGFVDGDRVVVDDGEHRREAQVLRLQREARERDKR